MAGPYDIYPGVDAGYNFPPEVRTSLMASTDIQGAIDARANAIVDKNRQGYNYRWANATARTNQTGMRSFDRGIQLDTGVEYVYDGTNWIDKTTNRNIYRKFPTLAALFNDTNYSDGDLATVSRFQYSNGILHNRSVWYFFNGYWSPVDGVVYVEAADATGTKQAASSVVNSAYAGNNRAYVPDGTRFINVVNLKQEYRWDSTRGVMGVRPGFLYMRGWAQWNFGPAPRSNWWSPPMDIQDDPFGVCNYDNGFTAPTPARYRASGVFGYSGDSSERILAAMSMNGGSDYWSSLPVGLRANSPAAWSVTFNADAGTQWSFRVYHESGTDYYAISGNNGAPVSSNSQYTVEILQPYQYN
jgi:hypothetical protein